MARLQWALPQEYGFFCMYICVLYLIRYLKDDSFAESKREEKIVKANWNENLTVFVLALATSIAIHFYATIMAFFICLAFAIFYVRRLFSKKRVFVLIAAVFVAVFLAVIPMLGALMSGIPFQNSIDWAVGVMNNDDAEEFPAPIPEANQRKTYEDDEFLPQSGTQLAGTTGNYGNTAKNEPVKISMKEKIEQKVTVTINRIQEKIKTIYYKSYVILYQTERAQIIVAGSLLVILLALIYYIFGIGMRMVLRNRRIQGDYFIHYLAIVLSSFFYMILYCATHLGLPSVVAGARLCSTVHLLILAILIIPIDIFIDVVQRKISERFVRVVSILITIGLVFLVYISDSYHGYLYYELTKYTTTTKISNALKGQLPPNVYTIVAPTEEIYQLWGSGRHEEMVTFLQKNVEGVSYTIPTEYVFFYIEKRPMQYGQIHLFSGPKWLALDKYSYVFEAFNPSVCPNVTAMEISEDMAEHDIMYFGKPSDTYALIYSRTVLQSKMYEWCKRFDELYPNELKTFYEDDDFVCYYIKQNTEYLYDLVIK